jgi:phosphonopyruvate decarboxylase
MMYQTSWTPFHIKVKSDLPMTREKAISVMLPLFGDHDAVVATTGFMSRELYELREINRQKHDHDFYCVGKIPAFTYV